MIYSVDIKETAQKDLYFLAMHEPKAFEKAQSLIKELEEHPKTGTGHPEQLKGEPKNRWSRRITKQHRLVYEIHDRQVLVLVLAAYGHYDDK